jgi:hypothetical protein
MTVSEFISKANLKGARYIEVVTCDSPRMSAAMSYYIDRRCDLLDSEAFDSRERLRAMRMFRNHLGARVKRAACVSSDRGIVLTIA